MHKQCLLKGIENAVSRKGLLSELPFVFGLKV